MSSPGKEIKGKSNCGAVYIYKYLPSSGWILNKEVVSPTPKSNLFGYSCSISSELLVVSSLLSSEAYVYSNNNGYNLISILKPLVKEDKKFGNCVYAIKNNIVVGCEGEYSDDKSLSNSTSAGIKREKMVGVGCCYYYIYRKEKCNFSQRITARDKKANMHFGSSVSMSDSLMVIGAMGDETVAPKGMDGQFAGAAFIFKKNVKGKWEEVIKLVDRYRMPGDKFGFSVSAYGVSVSVGSRFEKEDQNEKFSLENAGAVYIYESMHK